MHDPIYSSIEIEKLGLSYLEDFSMADAVILQTNHYEYEGLTQEKFANARIFVDGRNFLAEQVRKGSATYLALGIG